MPRTIIVPVDLSQQDAGAKALAEARKYDRDARLIVLYVASEIPAYVAADLPEEIVKAQAEKAHKELSSFADRVGVAREMDLVVRTGHPGREILDQAAEAGAELIVIASHDPAWGDFLLGSVAAFVVRHAHCSVLVVRDHTGKRRRR